MKPIIKIGFLFILSISIILMLPYVSHAEDWATYDTPNITYGSILCGTGTIHPNQSCYWCWIDYPNKTMDHSFMNFSQMDSYYNASGDGSTGGGDTYSFSFYQELPQNSAKPLEPEQSLLSGIITFINGLFVGFS